MRELAPAIAGFYNGNPVALPLVCPEGEGLGQELWIPASEVDVTDEEVTEKVRESRFFVMEQDGSEFETVVFNGEHADKGVLLAISTYSSSASGNPGNWWETARVATLHPDVAIAYIASPGNGRSGPLTKKEMLYYGLTGRVTHNENGRAEPLPTFRNLASGLQRNGLPVTRLLGSSAGSLFATATGAALPEGQVSHAAFNAHPQMTATIPIVLAKRALYDEMIQEAGNARRLTPDKSTVTASRCDMVREARPDVYAPEHRSREVGKIAMLATNMVALAHGPSALERDVEALLERQPDLQLSFVVGEGDRLHAPGLLYNVRGVIDYLSERSHESSVQAVLIPGSHVFNTHFVRMYETIMDKLLELPQPQHSR